MQEYDNNFFDERDLIEALNRGCEVEFLYDNKKYSITHLEDKKIIIGEFYNLDSVEIYTDPQKAMEYEFGDKKLRDIISDMKVIDRSF